MSWGWVTAGNESLLRVLRERFVRLHRGDDALRTPPPVMQVLAFRTGLEIASDNAAEERWMAVRFGDDGYMAIVALHPERVTEWYHLGPWPQAQGGIWDDYRAKTRPGTAI